MNLALLHTGWLGALEAGLIAFVIGGLLFALWYALARRLQWPEGHAIGWASLSAVAIAAGIDIGNLVPLFFVNPGSATRIGASLAGIHDPGGLGRRVVFEMIGALIGVLLTWVWTESRKQA
ncbi:MAG: hypothetical protein ACREO8_10835 [Luteimonas sp.]